MDLLAKACLAQGQADEALNWMYKAVALCRVHGCITTTAGSCSH